MERKKKLRIDLASLSPSPRELKPNPPKSFADLMGYCEYMKDDIEMTWEIAKTESLTRCSKLNNLHKRSQMRCGISWKQMPKYEEIQIKLAERKQTSRDTTWARQVDEVLNLVDLKRTKHVLVKDISNTHIRRLISRCKRRFGEAQKDADLKPELSRARSQQAHRILPIEEVLMEEEPNHIYLTEADDHLLTTRLKSLERSLTSRQLTSEWDYDRLDDKNRIVFQRRDKYLYNNRKVFLMQRQKALDCKMRMIQPSDDIKRKAEWLVNHTPSMTSLATGKPKKLFRQKTSVSNASSPKIVKRFQTEDELFLKGEVQHELLDLKSRVSAARYVNDKSHKEKIAGRNPHRIISPSSMKLFAKIR